MTKLRLLLFLLALSLPAFGQGYTIQQYLNIKSAGAPTFSPDGNQIAYLTNVTGTNQVWVVNVAGGAPKQLTNFKSDLIFTFDVSKDGKSLALARGTSSNDVVLIADAGE